MEKLGNKYDHMGYEACQTYQQDILGLAENPPIATVGYLTKNGEKTAIIKIDLDVAKLEYHKFYFRANLCCAIASAIIVIVATIFIMISGVPLLPVLLPAGIAVSLMIVCGIINAKKVSHWRDVIGEQAVLQAQIDYDQGPYPTTVSTQSAMSQTITSAYQAEFLKWKSDPVKTKMLAQVILKKAQGISDSMVEEYDKALQMATGLSASLQT